jgi:Rrf2 family transcriptional regulator, iron-sulfur cluster assembly transcription factor
MLSNSSKYAIKAVLFLALNSKDNKKTMVKDISEPINVPQAYIAKLLQELSKKNIISSSRGPKGGFYLSEADMHNSLMDIINIIDGDNRFQSCELSLEKCNLEKPCPLHDLMYPIKTRFIKVLQDKTIKEFSILIKQGKVFLPF